MEPKNTADAGPFNLGDLCALMALDPPQLAAFLAPLRDLRADGIFPRQLSERDTDLALDPPVVLIDAAPGWKDAPIRLSKFGYAVADLPFPFRWSELLKFFDVEGDAAWEVERKLTNDPGPADRRPPIDAAALCRLEARSPALAALVRPLLEAGAGGRWWRTAVGTTTGKAAEAVAAPAQREAAGGPGERWTPELLAIERSRAAKAAAEARHAPTRNAKALVLDWWKVNKASMNKEDAADAIVSARLVNETRSTIRGWLKGA